MGPSCWYITIFWRRHDAISLLARGTPPGSEPEIGAIDWRVNQKGLVWAPKSSSAESASARRFPAPPWVVMMTDLRLPYLAALERKILWLASWTIHNANHVRANIDGMKVGGHQASSASLSTIMTALYLAVLEARGPGRGEAACEPDLPRHPVSARPPDAGEAREFPRLQGRADPIRRAPRTSTMSISPPVRSASASRRRCLPASCRIM